MSTFGAVSFVLHVCGCMFACMFLCVYCAGAYGNTYMEAREQSPVLFLLMCCPPCFSETGFLSGLSHADKLGVLTSFTSADITYSHLRGGSFTSVNHLLEKNSFVSLNYIETIVKFIFFVMLIYF